MPTQEGILTVILVAIVANLLVAIGLLVGPRIRRRRMDRDESAEINRQVLLRAHLFGSGNDSVERSRAAAERPSFRSPQAPFRDGVAPRMAAPGTPLAMDSDLARSIARLPNRALSRASRFRRSSGE